MRSQDVIRIVRDMTREVRGKLKGLVKRATLGTLDAGKKAQALQTNGLADDADDDVELFEPYGFTSAPPAGAEGLLLAVGGDRGGTVGVCFGDRSTRPTDLEQGEVRVYHPEGSHVRLLNDGSIEVFAAPGQVVRLGGAGGLPVARETDPVVIPSLTVLQAAINGWVPAPNDGGAALKTALSAWLGADVQDGTIEAGGAGSEST